MVIIIMTRVMIILLMVMIMKMIFRRLTREAKL